MNIAIIGSRTFNDFSKLKTIINNYIKTNNIKVTAIVSGGAKGADSLGERYAKENKIKTIIFKPNWKKYGKSAGFKRNKDIIDNCDIVIAFWDGKSKGTEHSLKIAKKQNKIIKIYYF